MSAASLKAGWSWMRVLPQFWVRKTEIRRAQGRQITKGCGQGGSLNEDLVVAWIWEMRRRVVSKRFLGVKLTGRLEKTKGTEGVVWLQ